MFVRDPATAVLPGTRASHDRTKTGLDVWDVYRGTTRSVYTRSCLNPERLQSCLFHCCTPRDGSQPRDKNGIICQGYVYRGTARDSYTGFVLKSERLRSGLVFHGTAAFDDHDGGTTRVFFYGIRLPRVLRGCCMRSANSFRTPHIHCPIHLSRLYIITSTNIMNTQ